MILLTIIIAAIFLGAMHNGFRNRRSTDTKKMNWWSKIWHNAQAVQLPFLLTLGVCFADYYSVDKEAAVYRFFADFIAEPYMQTFAKSTAISIFYGCYRFGLFDYIHNIFFFGKVTKESVFYLGDGNETYDLIVIDIGIPMLLFARFLLLLFTTLLLFMVI